MKIANAEQADCSDSNLSKVSRYFSKSLSTEDFFNRVKKTTVSLHIKNTDGNSGACSGFLYENKSLVMTNMHCILDATEVTAEFYDGNMIDVEGIKAYVPWKDVVVLSLKSEYALGEAIRSFSSVNIGDRIMSLPGCNANLAEKDALNGFSYGHAKKLLSITHADDGLVFDEYYQNSKGKSGALIINTQGEATGIMRGSIKTIMNQYLPGKQNSSVTPPINYKAIDGISGRGLIAQLSYYDEVKTFSNFRSDLECTDYGHYFLAHMTSDLNQRYSHLIKSNQLNNFYDDIPAYAFFMMADIYLAKNNLHEAKKYFLKALSRHEYPIVYYNLARIEYLTGNEGLALVYLNRCLKIDPYHIPAILFSISIYTDSEWTYSGAENHIGRLMRRYQDALLKQESVKLYWDALR